MATEQQNESAVLNTDDAGATQPEGVSSGETMRRQDADLSVHGRTRGLLRRRTKPQQA